MWMFPFPAKTEITLQGLCAPFCLLHNDRNHHYHHRRHHFHRHRGDNRHHYQQYHPHHHNFNATVFIASSSSSSGQRRREGEREHRKPIRLRRKIKKTTRPTPASHITLAHSMSSSCKERHEKTQFKVL